MPSPSARASREVASYAPGPEGDESGVEDAVGGRSPWTSASPTRHLPYGRQSPCPRCVSLQRARRPQPVLSIPTGLAGKRIMVTGATGFLGTAVVERLLRSVPDCEVVVLVRPTRRLSATERTGREIVRNDCFDRLRVELGRGLRRADRPPAGGGGRRREPRRSRPRRRGSSGAGLLRRRHPLGRHRLLRRPPRHGGGGQPPRTVAASRPPSSRSWSPGANCSPPTPPPTW